MHACTHTRTKHAHTHTHACTNTHRKKIHPCAHPFLSHSLPFMLARISHTHTHTHTCINRHVTRRRRGEVLTPFLHPALFNDGDIAHGSSTASWPLLHTTLLHGREGGGWRGGGERGREGSAHSLTPSLPRALPLARSVALSLSLSLTHTHTHTHKWCVVSSPLVVVFFPSHPSFLSLVLSLQTSPFSPGSDSAWKEVREKKKNVRIYISPPSFSSPPNPFHSYTS